MENGHARTIQYWPRSRTNSQSPKCSFDGPPQPALSRYEPKRPEPYPDGSKVARDSRSVKYIPPFMKNPAFSYAGFSILEKLESSNQFT